MMVNPFAAVCVSHLYLLLVPLLSLSRFEKEEEREEEREERRRKEKKRRGRGTMKVQQRL